MSPQSRSCATVKLLLLAHAFNGLTQRLHCALREAGHAVTVELDISDAVTEEAVALAEPDLVIAPFLKRRIPESVWSVRPCLVVHPGPPGDRGPAALDWAVLRGDARWRRHGAAGHAASSTPARCGPGARFALRAGRDQGQPVPARGHARRGRRRCWRRSTALGPAPAAPASPPACRRTAAAAGSGPVPAAQRAIDWTRDDTATVLRKIRSADGHPGVADALFGRACRLHDAHPASADDAARARRPARPATSSRGAARRCCAARSTAACGSAMCAASRRRASPALKLAATRAFAAECGRAARTRRAAAARRRRVGRTALRRDRPEPAQRVGWLRFDFHNGAMSTRQCERLRDALRFARSARHAGAGARRRQRLLQQRHPPARHRGRARTTPATAPPMPPGATSRRSTTSCWSC